MDAFIELYGWVLKRRRWPARLFLGRTKRGEDVASERRAVYFRPDGALEGTNAQDIIWDSEPEAERRVVVWDAFGLFDRLTDGNGLGVGTMTGMALEGPDCSFVINEGDLRVPLGYALDRSSSGEL